MTTSTPNAAQRFFLLMRAQRLSNKVEAGFIRSLADLLQAGIDLPWALQTVATLSGSKRLQQSCEEQAAAILQGSPWSDILLESSRPTWPDSLIAWVRVAQCTGALVECLNGQHRQWAAAQAFKSSLGKRLSYPAGVLCLSLALTWFTGSQFQSDSAQAMWLTAAVGFCATGIVCAGIWQYRKRNGVCEMRIWSNCLHACALMTKTGLSWTQTLETLIEDLSALWTVRRHIGLALQDCLDLIHAGQDIHSAAQGAGLPDALLRSLKLAQISGDLHAALSQSANLFDLRCSTLQDRLLSALPSAALALAAATLAIQYALFIQPLYAQLGAQ